MPLLLKLALFLDHADMSDFRIEAVRIVKIFGLMVLAGLAEIGGGWLVWQQVRCGKPWWWSAGRLAVFEGGDPWGCPASFRVYLILGSLRVVMFASKTCLNFCPEALSAVSTMNSDENILASFAP